MKKINKCIIRIKCFFIEWKFFGFIIAFCSLIWPFMHLLPQKWAHVLMKRKHQFVIDYLRSRYGDKIKTFAPLGTRNGENKLYPIWVCWLQGEDQLPKVPRVCIYSIRKYAGKHPVIIISLQNYQQYITIPDYILEKYNKGIISHAHFSDIIRTCLLYERGGVWIDATILVTKELPEILFTSPFYSIKIPDSNFYITSCKWSNFFLCSHKGNIIFEFTRMLFFEYLKKEDYFIDYFMMDYFIHIGYEEYSEIRQQIDNVPFNNENIHQLGSLMNTIYNTERFQILKQNTYLFKLSWKSYLKEKVDNHITFWGFIKNNIHNS